MSCYLPSKGRDFQAIHNKPCARLGLMKVVTYPVKVEIFKQFTTADATRFFVPWLLLTQ